MELDQDRIDRSRAQLVRQARAMEAELRRDPIAALGLQFDAERGWTAQPFAIRTEGVCADFDIVSPGLPAAGAAAWSPPAYARAGVEVCPLAVQISPWATVVAVRVSHRDPDRRLRLDWVAKDGQASAVFLLDADHDRYYYPVSTTLAGDVVAGHPRTGLIAFEPFLEPTDRFQLHLSNVTLAAGGGAHTFHFAYRGPGLADAMATLLDRRSLAERIAEAFDSAVRQAERESKRAEREAKRAVETALNRGCLTALLCAVALLLAMIGLFGSVR
jgi:hypothetical protein